MPDPTTERDTIRAAMQRLFAGQPLRSTGALTILQLATEAGVKRWVLTHKHTDLKDEFNRRKQDTNSIPPAFQHLHARVIDLEAANTKLRDHNRELAERVEIYAQVIHELRTQLDRQTAADPHIPNIHNLASTRRNSTKPRQ